MNQATGFVLIAFGAGLAGYSLLRDKPDEERHLAEVTRIAVLDQVSSDPSTANRQSGRWDMTGWMPFARSDDRDTAVEAAKRPRNPERNSQGGAETEIKPWTTVVTTARQDLQPSIIANAQAAPDHETHAALTTDIQSELQRIGCYTGQVDGRWNEATRRAVGDFVKQSNASLPIDQPDYVLLALAQAHKGGACAPCQASGGIATDGLVSCSDAPLIVADAGSKPKKVARSKRRKAPTEAQPSASGETQTITAEVLPWAATVTAPDRQFAADPPPARQPLSGRMAIGGPAAEQPAPPASGTSKFDTLAALQEPAQADVLPAERRAAVPLPAAASIAKPAKPAAGRTASVQAPKKAAKRKAKRGRPQFYYSSYGSGGWGRRNAYRRRGYDGSMTLWGMF